MAPREFLCEPSVGAMFLQWICIYILDLTRLWRGAVGKDMFELATQFAG